MSLHLRAFTGNLKEMNVPADAEREAGLGVLLREAGDARNVPLEAAGKNLQAKPRQGMAFRADETLTDGTGRKTTLRLAHEVQPPMEGIDECASVDEHIILAERRERRLQNTNARIAEDLQLPKMLLQNDAGKHVGSIRADALGLIRIRHLEPKTKGHPWAALLFSKDSDLRPKREIADVARRIVGGQMQRREAGALTLDVKEIPHCALELDFYNASDAQAQIEHSDRC